MTAADGNRPHTDEGPILDEETTPKVRRFLEAIARPNEHATREAVERTPADAEAIVTRFAWSCEELNVAFGRTDANDPQVCTHLLDHGVDATLREIHTKTTAMLAAIDRARDSEIDVHDR
jgi:hypothetical protein